MSSTLFTLPESTSHLKSLKSGLAIPATEGKRTFISEHKKFTDAQKKFLGRLELFSLENYLINGFFDQGFYTYETDIASGEKPEAQSELYEMTHDGDFNIILGSLNCDPNFISWRSEDQIMTWIEHHRSHLCPGRGATFFPLIVSGRNYVVHTNNADIKLEFRINPLERKHDWYVEFEHRLVIPHPTSINQIWT